MAFPESSPPNDSLSQNEMARVAASFSRRHSDDASTDVYMACCAALTRFQGNAAKTSIRSGVHKTHIDLWMDGVVPMADLGRVHTLTGETQAAHQARRIKPGKVPDICIAPPERPDFERNHLRDAFVLLRRMQSAVG